jgi:cold shock CspA family protein
VQGRQIELNFEFVRRLHQLTNHGHSFGGLRRAVWPEVNLSHHPAAHGKQQRLEFLQVRLDRGFRFIAPGGDHAHVLLYVSHIANADALKKDQRVSFDIVAGDRRNKPRSDKVWVMMSP